MRFMGLVDAIYLSPNSCAQRNIGLVNSCKVTSQSAVVHVHCNWKDFLEVASNDILSRIYCLLI